MTPRDVLHVVVVAIGLPGPTRADQAAVGACEYGIVGVVLAGAWPTARWAHGEGP